MTQAPILVTGATGRTGGMVVQQLVAKGVPVRAFVHDMKKAAALRDLNVEIVQGDFTQRQTLQVALNNVRKAYLVSSGELIKLEGSFIEAAKQAGVIHIVRHSGSFLVRADIDIDFDRWHYQAEQQLEHSGIGFTHLRPSFFMHNLFFYLSSGKIALPMKNARVNMVDCRDIAAVAVAALTHEGHTGQTYQITGPEALTFGEVASKLSAVLEKPITYIPISALEFARVLEQWNFPPSVAQAVATEYELISNGDPAFEHVRDTVLKVTGQAPRSLDQFAREYRQVLLANVDG